MRAERRPPRRGWEIILLDNKPINQFSLSSIANVEMDRHWCSFSSHFEYNPTKSLQLDGGSQKIITLLLDACTYMYWHRINISTHKTGNRLAEKLLIQPWNQILISGKNRQWVSQAEDVGCVDVGRDEVRAEALSPRIFLAGEWIKWTGPTRGSTIRSRQSRTLILSRLHLASSALPCPRPGHWG